MIACPLCGNQAIKRLPSSPRLNLFGATARAPERDIRGVATLDERAALADEGIDVVSLPLPNTLKQSLQ